MLYGLGRRNFKMLLLKKSNTFKATNVSVQIVPLISSWGKKGAFKEVMFRMNLENIIRVSCQIYGI